MHDAEAIAHVHTASWRTTYAGIVPKAYLATLNEAERALQWREWLTPGALVFVAELPSEGGKPGAIVGFIGGGPIREPLDGYDAELFAMYLLQHAQKRGIGTALLQVLAGSLHVQGFQSMAAWVLAGNASSRFYQKSGAVPLASKEVEIAGAMLPVLAYGWPSLETILQHPI